MLFVIFYQMKVISATEVGWGGGTTKKQSDLNQTEHDNAFRELLKVIVLYKVGLYNRIF